MSENIEKAPNVPPFVRFVASAVPMVFDDSMSYYEALSALWKYMQDTVDIINNNATVTEEYIKLTDQMKEYMDNYFDNLDVQDQINNKLDKMVADGTMTEILSVYVTPQLNDLNYKIDQGLADEANTRLQEDNRLQSQISGLASGAPLAASSTDEMTDTSKIYVNTTDGKWYYYNGEEWTIGGTYQSAVNPIDVEQLEDDLSNLATDLEVEHEYDGGWYYLSPTFHELSDFHTLRYIIPSYITKIYVNTWFYAGFRVYITNISNPSQTLVRTTNSIVDPVEQYNVLTNHVATYDLSETTQYKYLYVPYHVAHGTPTVKIYNSTAFISFQNQIDDLHEDVNDVAQDLSFKLASNTTYDGYWTGVNTEMRSSEDFKTYRYTLPEGATKITIKTKYYGSMTSYLTDIADPTTTPLMKIGQNTNAYAVPYDYYTTLQLREVTYDLSRYYKYLYVPCYEDTIPEITVYRSSQLATAWAENNPLANKKFLIFGDSITYIASRWRDTFYKITRGIEVGCCAYTGAHLADQSASVPLDGNYNTDADNNVHNNVCNQVYYWVNNAPEGVEPDYIIISAGTNDYYSSPEQLATDVNVYATTAGWIDVDTINRTTFEGAMRWATSKLREKHPNATIIFASPIQSAQDIGIEKSIDVFLAKEAKMERACDHLSARLIKATSESGITGEFEANGIDGRYLVDGLHPNANGGNLLGTFYANTLVAMFQKENNWDKYTS